MADTRTNPNPPHDCPGGCGSKVPHAKLACFECWWLLPEEMRKAITDARGHERLVEVGKAARWYREHVAGGRLVDAPEQPHLTITLDESWRPGRGGGVR